MALHGFAEGGPFGSVIDALAEGDGLVEGHHVVADGVTAFERDGWRDELLSLGRAHAGVARRHLHRFADGDVARAAVGEGVVALFETRVVVEVAHGEGVETVGEERRGNDLVVGNDRVIRDLEFIGYLHRLFEVVVFAGVFHALELRVGILLVETLLHTSTPLRAEAVEDTAHGAVALPVGGDCDRALQRTFLGDLRAGGHPDVMVFRIGNGRESQLRAFGQTHQVVLLLFRTGPELTPHARHPRGVEELVVAVAPLHHRDAVVELVGGDVLDALAGHRHRSVGLEACRSQHADEHPGLVFADAAAVAEGHLALVEREPLALAHRDAGVADVVGHPVCEDVQAVVLGLRRLQQLINLRLDFRCGLEAAEILVHAVEPHRLGLPIFRRGHDDFRLDVVARHRVARGFQREIVLVLESEKGAVAVFLGLHGHASVIDFVLQVLARQHTDLIDFFPHGLAVPEGDDVVEVAAHGRDVLRVGVVALQQRVGEALLVGEELHLIAGFEAAEGDHLLPCAPVDHVGRRGVVADHEVGVFLGTVVAIDDHVANLAVGRQGIVIDDDGVVVAPAGIAQDPVTLVVDIVAEAVLLHAHGHAVIEGHAVVAGVGVVLLRHRRHAEAQQQGGPK